MLPDPVRLAPFHPIIMTATGQARAAKHATFIPDAAVWCAAWFGLRGRHRTYHWGVAHGPGCDAGMGYLDWQCQAPLRTRPAAR